MPSTESAGTASSLGAQGAPDVCATSVVGSEADVGAAAPTPTARAPPPSPAVPPNARARAREPGRQLVSGTAKYGYFLWQESKSFGPVPRTSLAHYG